MAFLLLVDPMSCHLPSFLPHCVPRWIRHRDLKGPAPRVQSVGGDDPIVPPTMPRSSVIVAVRVRKGRHHKYDREVRSSSLRIVRTDLWCSTLQAMWSGRVRLRRCESRRGSDVDKKSMLKHELYCSLSRQKGHQQLPMPLWIFSLAHNRKNICDIISKYFIGSK
jgi:hypothetical protein